MIPVSNQPQLVIFDCDGVLVDSELLAAEAMCDVYRAHDMTITPADIEVCIGMKQADILKTIAGNTGHVIPEEALAEFWPATRAVFARSLAPTEGVADFIAGLSVPVCVASSSAPERIAFSLERTGLRPLFGDALFSSTMVAHGKPAPDLFLLAAERMGAAPRDCVVIEDSPYGIMGAKRAGMTAIGFTGASHASDLMRGRLSAAEPHAMCSSWDEVRAQIAAA